MNYAQSFENNLLWGEPMDWPIVSRFTWKAENKESWRELMDNLIWCSYDQSPIENCCCCILSQVMAKARAATLSAVSLSWSPYSAVIVISIIGSSSSGSIRMWFTHGWKLDFVLTALVFVCPHYQLLREHRRAVPVLQGHVWRQRPWRLSPWVWFLPITASWSPPQVSFALENAA